MSIDKDLLDRLMEGRSAGDLFGKTGIFVELTSPNALRASSPPTTTGSGSLTTSSSAKYPSSQPTSGGSSMGPSGGG